MSDEETLPELTPEPPRTSRDKVEFTYIKSQHFRVIHVDGAIGGPGPRRSVFMSFFSERLPIPKHQAYRRGSDWKLGEEILAERKSLTGIVREVEAAVVLDVATAKSVLQWLAEKIAIVERLETELKDSPGSGNVETATEDEPRNE